MTLSRICRSDYLLYPTRSVASALHTRADLHTRAHSAMRTPWFMLAIRDVSYVGCREAASFDPSAPSTAMAPMPRGRWHSTSPRLWSSGPSPLAGGLLGPVVQPVRGRQRAQVVRGEHQASGLSVVGISRHPLDAGVRFNSSVRLPSRSGGGRVYPHVGTRCTLGPRRPVTPWPVAWRTVLLCATHVLV